jgi:hypothetical protein
MRWIVLGFVVTVVVLGIVAGCQSPPERIPLQPLPENGKGLDYGEVVQRARLYTIAATDAFYVNKWNELDEAGRNLEMTALLLPKATDVPAKQQEKLDANAAELSRDAGQLRAAAKGQDVKRTNEILQRLHLKVRELRP